jgi:transposase
VCTGDGAEIERLERELAVACEQGDAAVARAEQAEAREEALRAKVAQLAALLYGDSSERRSTSGAGGEDGAGRDGASAGGGEDGAGEEGAGEGQGRSRGVGRRGQQPGRAGHGRRDYGHLPCEEVIHQPDPAELVCGCGAAYECFGEDRREEMDCEVRLWRRLHRRPRYRQTCGCGEAKGVVAAPAVASPTGQGRLAAGLLARLVCGKFLHGVPVNRMRLMWACEGADFAVGTLTGALRDVGGLLAPLAGAIRARNAAAGHLHVDETSWKVFAAAAGKTNHRWWLWVFAAADTTAFSVKPGRGAGVVAEHLGVDLDGELPVLPGGGELVVSSDFYPAYQRLGRDVAGVSNSWCWSHMRRYFLRAGQNHPGELGGWAEGWLERIDTLFAVHRKWALAAAESDTEAEAAGEIAAVVGEMDRLRHVQQADGDLPGPAHEVLATFAREWDGLTAFLYDPVVPLDNNRAERALRTPVVGRKNYHGSGAQWSAELAADAWTILATAGQNGLSGQALLTDYLQACAAAGGTAPAGAALARFFPWAVEETDQTRWSHPP